MAIQGKVLSHSEIREAKLDTLRVANKEDVVFVVQEAIKTECLKRMITHVSEGPAQPPVNKDTVLKPVSLQDFETPTSPFYFEKLFSNPKDMDVLDELYKMYHEIDISERSNIAGKIIPVSLD